VLGQAAALLHLVHFDEPFGLSVAEAMCCGTPVIAYDRGAMPELIKHGKTGFIVTTIGEAVDAVNNLERIRRADCSEWARSAFSLEKMTRDYLRVYEKILKPEMKWKPELRSET
jgi:glycosyltransferase involved in cell wall biosynthesis